MIKTILTTITELEDTPSTDKEEYPTYIIIIELLSYSLNKHLITS
jgi:hypothetical protein